MSTVTVVAPHPDDETLGCGGTLLRHRAEGDEVHWLIVTTMTQAAGFDNATIAAREDEIDAVAAHYGFSGVHRLGFAATELDRVPRSELVQAVGRVFDQTRAETIYVPFEGDAHSDHAVAFHAAIAGSKWFRRPAIRRIYAYETLSETEFGHACDGFRPNLFVDISDHLEDKVAALKLYRGEIGEAPFPRSEPVLRAQAQVRGSNVGCAAAEAFQVVREVR